MKMKINWWKVGEIGGFLISAIGTFVGNICGTRNGVKEEAEKAINAEIEKMNKEHDETK